MTDDHDDSLHEGFYDINRGVGGAWISFDRIPENEARTAAVAAQDALNIAMRAFHSALGDGDAPYARDLAAFESRAETDRFHTLDRLAAVVASLHIEGTVNAWCCMRLGEKYVEDHLDRGVSVTSKIALLTAILGMGLMHKDNRLIAPIRHLVSRRNGIVHPKTVNVGPDTLKQQKYQRTTFNGTVANYSSYHFEAAGRALDAFKELLDLVEPDESLFRL